MRYYLSLISMATLNKTEKKTGVRHMPLVQALWREASLIYTVCSRAAKAV